MRRVAEARAEALLEEVVVGCTAAIFHMAPLLTLDLDLLVRDAPLNRRKIRKVGELLGSSRFRPPSCQTSSLLRMVRSPWTSPSAGCPAG
ncbi:MAG: hypothetical protein FJ086_07760 [Deltaproteobacteria bacterium]|nr:hypothetical protein [Deltaproteobacteria bacterium]